MGPTEIIEHAAKECALSAAGLHQLLSHGLMENFLPIKERFKKKKQHKRQHINTCEGVCGETDKQKGVKECALGADGLHQLLSRCQYFF